MFQTRPAAALAASNVSAVTPTPTTFQHAVAFVSTCPDWTPQTQRELKCGLRQIAWSMALVQARRRGYALDVNRKSLDLSSLPFDVSLINETLAGISYGLAGFQNDKSFRNAKSALRRVGRKMNLVAPKLPPKLPLDNPYAALLALTDRRNHAAACLFAARLLQQDKLPEVVTNADLAEYGTYLHRVKVGTDVKVMLKRLARLWRQTAAQCPEWPQAPLRAPTPPRPLSPPLSIYPTSLQQDVAAVQSWMEGSLRTGPFDGHFARRPLRPATVKHRLGCIRLMLGVLVELGTDPVTLTSLQALLEPATAQAILQALWDRGQHRRAAKSQRDQDDDGSGATGQTNSAGQVLLMLATHCFPQPPAVLKQLQHLARAVRPATPAQMSRKNRIRLDQFRDPATLQRLLASPHTLMREAIALRQQGQMRTAARRARTAILLSIEIRIPLRIQNLRSCRLGHNLRFAGAHSQMVTLGFEAAETKNWLEVEFYVGPRLCQLLNLYIRDFLPVLAAGSPDFAIQQWLFPAGEGRPGPLSGNRVREIIIDTVGRRVGAEFHSHLFRALAVKLCLQHSPNALEHCRQLLGDKTMTVLLRHYAPVQQREAAAYLDRLVAAEEDRLDRLARLGKRSACRGIAS